jgi:VIT1/CCC1 family predicted Fe2+/Mn2+ transporter
MKAFSSRKNKYLFGSTSAIITDLALIVGLANSVNAKTNIIAGLLVIAIADNISDSLSIHIYQEAEGLTKKEVWVSSLTNFLIRLLVSAVFIVMVALLPLRLAIMCSIIFGLLLIMIFSYDIARYRNINPGPAVIEHLLIAVAVIVASGFLSNWVGTKIH